MIMITISMFGKWCNLMIIL